MPKIKSQTEKEKAQIEFECALIHRGAKRENPALWLAKKLGLSEVTSRSRINDPMKLTLQEAKRLQITAEEYAAIVGG